MIRPIVSYGNPVLTQPAKAVEQYDTPLQELIRDMFETMEHSEGVGLAAPQVNESLRLFIMGEAEGSSTLPPPEKWPGWVFINPEIVELNGLLKTDIEGCLSIPGIEVSLARPSTLRLRYHDENFEQQERTFTGYIARVIQHEYDHIEGVLMTDRMNSHRQRSLHPFLKKVAKGGIPTDYEMLFNTESKSV